MAAEDNPTKEKEYDDFKLQFDEQYGICVTNGHKEWIEKELVKEIQRKFLESQTYRVLSVGSGTGFPDVGLLEVLSKLAKAEGSKDKTIIYTVSEPDPKAVDVCKANFEKFTNELNIEFRYVIAPSEKFLLESEDEFDLIHFVHVISWLKDHEKVLKRCFEKMLVKGGLIPLVDFDTGGERASQGGEGEKQDSAECGEEKCGGPMFVRVDLIAAKYNWDCRKFPHKIKIDLTDASKDTEKGRRLARFWIGLQVDATNMTAEEFEKRRKDLVESLEKDEIQGETKYYFSLNEMIYFLSK